MPHVIGFTTGPCPERGEHIASCLIDDAPITSAAVVIAAIRAGHEFSMSATIGALATMIATGTPRVVSGDELEFLAVQPCPRCGRDTLNED